MTLSNALHMMRQGWLAGLFVLAIGCSTEDPPRLSAGNKPAPPSADAGAGARGGNSSQGTPSSDPVTPGTSQSGGSQPTDSGTSIPTSQNPAQNDPVTCIDGEAQTCEIEAAIVKYTNEFRASQGLTVMVAHEPHLSYVARDWSHQQATAGAISHDGFPDARLDVFATRFPTLHMKFTYIGENVLFNTYLSTVADLIGKNMVDQWIASPPHRANMLNNYTSMGAGVWKSGNRWYGTQFFLNGSVN